MPIPQYALNPKSYTEPIIDYSSLLHNAVTILIYDIRIEPVSIVSKGKTTSR